VPQLIKEAVRIAIKQSGAKDNTYNWVTSVYPIIHLPNDTSELGYLHTDKIQYAGDMITIWVPLNSGQHSPLSILPKSHFLSNFVISKGSSLIFSQTFIFNLLEKIGLIIKLKHDTGDLLFWNGNTQHTGNLNTTNAPTVALVIRMTKNPILSEATLSFDELHSQEYSQIDGAEHNTFNTYMDINKKLQASYDDFSMETFSLKEEVEIVISTINQYNFNQEEKHRLSCAFGFFGLRLREDIKPIYQFLFSALLSKDSILAFEHILLYCVGVKPDNEIIFFLEKYLKNGSTKQTDYYLQRFSKKGGDELRDWCQRFRPSNSVLLWTQS